MGARCPTRRIRDGLMTKPRRPRRKPLDPARQAAFDVLRAVSERDAYANLVLPALLRERGITGRDAAFATELAYGTCRSPRAARRRHRRGRGTAAGPHRPGAARPAAAGHLPAAAHPRRRARRGVHHRRAGRHRIRFGASRFRQRRAAHHLRGATSSRGSTSWRPPPATDPVGHMAFVHAHPRWIAPGVRRCARRRRGGAGRSAASGQRPAAGASRRPARRADRR